MIIFLGCSLVEMPVSGSGSGVPNQRLRVFVLVQLSTTWLNSSVKGSTQARIFGMSINTAVVAMAFSNAMKLVQ